MKKLLVTAAFSAVALSSSAQNSVSDSWNFNLSSGASFGINSNERSLFRGNSIATQLSGRYQFGKIGLGFSGGLVPGSISKSSVSEFLVERKIDPAQAQVLMGKPSNSYLLVGPSLELGNRIKFLTQVQGGLFVNDPGSLSIQQNGAQRASYSFNDAGKNLYPGFSASVQIAYPVTSGSRFFISSDYFNSRSSVRLTDLQSGIDVPTEQSKLVSLFTAGIGFSKSFGGGNGQNSRNKPGRTKYSNRNSGPREAGSGLATGRRILPEQPSSVVSNREAGSGLATGRRSHLAVSPDAGGASCGPVVRTVTYPDGTTEDMSFACPADAASYLSRLQLTNTPRLSTNMSVERQTPNTSFGEKVNAGLHAAGSRAGKQTQGATFGEKVNAGLYAAGGALAQGKTGTNFISGNLHWDDAAGSNSIQTNLNQAGNGATNQSVNNATLYAREAGSGMSTGKRSREAGSGMATGRRQYQPLVIRHESPSKCGGIKGMDIFLVDNESESIIAHTKTEECGDFWFANVPDGDYRVQVNGIWFSKKGYDFVIENNVQDVAGQISSSPAFWQLELNTGIDSTGETARRIKTKSNIKNDRMAGSQTKIITFGGVDDDNDGVAEATVGGALPGGGIVSAAVSRVGPIKGVIVRGSKADARLASTVTNEFGEFEIKQVPPGTHQIEIEQAVAVFDETVVILGRETAPSQQKAFNQNASRSNHTRTALMTAEAGMNTASVKQYKSILIEIDSDGDGIFDTDISNSFQFTASEDGADSQKAGISTSRSNIRTKSSLTSLGNELYSVSGTTIYNGTEVPFQAILKTRHDTAKNSIGNIR